MTIQHTRREFIRHSGAASVALGLGQTLALGAGSVNEKLDIGAIGVGGRGHSDLMRVATENIVAVCDVDEQQLNKAAEQFPQAKKYVDYRALLETEELDAVVIGTPDHHHAPAAIRAMQRGLHVYCEKPLTHTVREARVLAETAREKGLVTQMGTQNHEHPGYLKLVDMLRDGVIGSVREVHVITDRPGKFWKQGLQVPTEKPAVPQYLNWDLWLGPAEVRDYHPVYLPDAWRGWWDFGCGAIGDMAIHLMDPAFWGLELGGPVTVTSSGHPLSPASGPTEMVATFEFGARGKLPACKLVWYEGTARPPQEIAELLPMNGSLYIGDDGMIAITHDGAPVLIQDGRHTVQEIDDSFSDSHHHLQWITACKTGGTTGSHFGYAGPFTETVLLGNIAFRVGESIEFDPATMKITNLPAANQFLDKEYRPGWEV